MLNRKEDKKATDVRVCRSVTRNLQSLDSYGIHHYANTAEIIPIVHAFFHYHLKKYVHCITGKILH